MANVIKHQGVIESIDGNVIRVKILQVSACASCNVKGYCTAADVKEKIVTVTDLNASTYQNGEKVWVVGQSSVGIVAILFAFVLPFLVVIVSLFVLMTIWSNELLASIGALAVLIPYYCILWLNKKRLANKLLFVIQPMDSKYKNN